MRWLIIPMLLIGGFVNAQTETKIKQSELPSPVTTMLTKKYAKYTTNKILKKENSDKETSFEVEVQKKNTVYTLVYNNNGELIDKIKSKSFTFDGSEPVRQQTPVMNDGHNHNH